jgi:hypothetical protein
LTLFTLPGELHEYSNIIVNLKETQHQFLYIAISNAKIRELREQNTPFINLKNLSNIHFDHKGSLFFRFNFKKLNFTSNVLVLMWRSCK